MSGYPLQVAWELRQRQEQAALARLDEARRARAAAEERAARRREAWDVARAAFEVARVAGSAVLSAREAADHDRYLARLRDARDRAQAACAEFEAGPLRIAHDAEEEARRAHADARRAREALDRHQQNFRSEERRAEERRDDEAAEEAARTARHHRQERGT